ncbi:MAG: histidine kinase dimerization/phospho-acceptor domain-containing protein, partial [Candidatus Binatia bacterium]
MKLVPFRDLSIRSKLSVLSMTASSTALLLACAAFVSYDVVTFRELTARRLVSQAEVVATNSASALLFDDEEAARKTLEALRAERQIVAATIYGSKGAPFAAYRRGRGGGPAAPKPLPAAPEYGHRFAGDHLEVLHPIVFDGESLGSIAIRSEIQEVTERVRRYLGIAFFVLLVSLGVAFVISSAPRRLILQPILHLADVARVVSREKDYSIRATRRGEDELGLLVDTFNDMLGQIEKRAQELQEARDAALESSRLKSAFLANMSHEIRTPLNVILGYTSLIGEYLEERKDRSQQDLLTAIHRGSQRLTETIDGILDISKIETRTFDMR